MRVKNWGHRSFVVALALGAFPACAVETERTEIGTRIAELTLTDTIITRAGSEFRDGTEPFYFSGTNNYYLWYAPLFCATGGSNKCVDEVLDDSVAMGLNVIRTWGFADGADAEGYVFQPEAGVYDEFTFAHFDEVVAMAKARGIRLIIPLVNNWDDFGGMNQYMSWVGGGSHDEFYTDAAAKQLYKDYVSYFINRVNTVTGVAYKDEPAIFAWELGNEPRAQTAGAAVFDAWVGEMSDFIRGQDSKHLIGTGIEGFYNGREGFTGWHYDGSQGTDFINNHSHPNIDFTSLHIYPDAWSFSAEDSMDWYNVHIDDSRHVLNKPVVVGEFGVAITAQGDISERDRIFERWYRLFEDKNAAGDMFWTLYGDEYPNYDDYGVYYPDDVSTVTVIEAHTAIMNGKSGQNSTIDEIAFSDIPGEGTISGSYEDMLDADGGYQVLTEKETGGKPANRSSTLEHSWRFWTTVGDAAELNVLAYRSSNNEGDDFEFQYSNDGLNFSTALTVTKTEPDGLYQTVTLPDTLRERVWIRVVDTNNDKGARSLDSLYIDHLFLRVTSADISTDSPPSVGINAPLSDDSVTGQVQINATVIDDGEVVSVEYTVDGVNYSPMTSDGADTWTVTWDASAATQGDAVTLTLRATDDAAQATLSSVVVHIDHWPNDADPSVSIAAPLSGTIVSGSVPIVITASDDSSVVSAEYRVDGGAWVAMASAGGGNFSASWDSTTVGDGDHVIGVRATDDIGQPSVVEETVLRVANVASLLVHVDSIVMSGKSYGPRRQASATVTILDIDGSPAVGVDVTVVWSGSGTPKTETKTTDDVGRISSYSNRADPGEFIATVTELTCADCFYDEAANLVATSSITLP